MVATSPALVSSVHNGQLLRPPGSAGVSLGSWDLVAVAQAGDRDAFGELYRRYVRQVSGVVYSRTRDCGLVEDLTSETFLRALRSVGSVSDRGRDLGVWLTVIARHVVADHYKAARSRREVPTAEVAELAIDRVGRAGQVIVDDDTAEQLRSGIAGLSAESRRCLWLRFYRDLSVAQTAAVMGRSRASVKALQYRALNRLRAGWVAERGGPGGSGHQRSTAQNGRLGVPVESDGTRLGLRASLPGQDRVSARAEHSSGDLVRRARVAAAAGRAGVSDQAEQRTQGDPLTVAHGWELVRAAQAGDRDAFGRLYQRYAGGVSRFVGRRLRDRGAVEDLTSETFVRALRRLDSVTDQGRDVGAWLTTIARNLVFDHVKSSRNRWETTTADIAGIADADAGQVSPEQVVIAAETARELHGHVAGLSADQRECVQRRFVEELSVAETAVVMGRNVGAVKALQHRAIVGLRAAMTSHHPALAAAVGGHRAAQRGRCAVQRRPVDPLAGARRAVAEVSELVAGMDAAGGEVERAQQRARWRVNDLAAPTAHDGQDRTRSAVVTEDGVW